MKSTRARRSAPPHSAVCCQRSCTSYSTASVHHQGSSQSAVSRQSVDSQSTVSRQSVNSQSTVSQQSARRQSVDSQSTASRQPVDSQSTVSPSAVSRSSVRSTAPPGNAREGWLFIFAHQLKQVEYPRCLYVKKTHHSEFQESYVWGGTCSLYSTTTSSVIASPTGRASVQACSRVCMVCTAPCCAPVLRPTSAAPSTLPQYSAPGLYPSAVPQCRTPLPYPVLRPSAVPLILRPNAYPLWCAS